MNNLVNFIRSKNFVFHLTGIILVLIVLFFGIIKWLNVFTDHDAFVTVPDFKDRELKVLETFVSDKEISFEIIDSVYDPKQKPGIVLRQDPEAGTNVKHNRKVYLYVTGMVPPQVIMPKLIDRSERQARLLLGSYGLKIGRVTEKQADCNGCVISQTLNGKEIAKGESVPKGSSIDLVIGVKDSYYITGKDTAKTEEPSFDNETP